VDFFRNFTEYERGFGEIHAEFWLGMMTVCKLSTIVYNYTVISYVIWEQSNCWPEVEGIVFWPLATVENIIPDTEGQLFDCSKITYKITVLLPDQ